MIYILYAVVLLVAAMFSLKLLDKVQTKCLTKIARNYTQQKYAKVISVSDYLSSKTYYLESSNDSLMHIEPSLKVFNAKMLNKHLLNTLHKNKVEYITVTFDNLDEYLAF